MFVNHFMSLTIPKNLHYLHRYLRFISTRKNIKVKYETHLHHVLPKASDFFPQYKNLHDHKFNGVNLTTREHFIAHQLLHKAFPGSTQTHAFYNMANIQGKRNSKAYQESRKHHIKSLATLHASTERNNKISKALTGKKKSAEHIAKLKGHEVKPETREKLRQHNLGKRASDQARARMTLTRTGIKRRPLSQEAKNNISNARKAQNRKWFNNGTESKQFSVPPNQHWVPGRLPWK